MYLTPHDPKPRETAVSDPSGDEAGTPSIRNALDDAFREWYADNYHALSLGGVGDTVTLAAMLMAACAKPFKSSSDAPKAS